MKALKFFQHISRLIFTSFVLLLSHITIVNADGVVVDKVYHPYVLPNKREVEWRLFSHKESKSNKLAQRFAYGQSCFTCSY